MIRLERFEERHLPGLEALFADADVQRFTRLPLPPPPDYGRTWLGRYEQARRDGTREAFAVVEGEELLGVAVAPTIDRETRTVELGYMVVPAARGRGVATEALRLLTEWAFRDLAAERLELYIGAANEPSKRVAARCGYVREGVLRSLWFKGDLREDTELWSRLPSDP